MEASIKPINEYTLQECLDAMKRLDADLLEYGYHEALADRIRDLTRWIPVEERLPDNESAVKVWVGYETYGKWCESSNRWFVDGPLGRLPVTHWRRIDTP